MERQKEHALSHTDLVHLIKHLSVGSKNAYNIIGSRRPSSSNQEVISHHAWAVEKADPRYVDYLVDCAKMTMSKVETCVRGEQSVQYGSHQNHVMECGRRTALFLAVGSLQLGPSIAGPEICSAKCVALCGIIFAVVIKVRHLFFKLVDLVHSLLPQAIHRS
jgi:hypothetical protein